MTNETSLYQSTEREPSLKFAPFPVTQVLTTAVKDAAPSLDFKLKYIDLNQDTSGFITMGRLTVHFMVSSREYYRNRCGTESCAVFSHEAYNTITLPGRLPLCNKETKSLTHFWKQKISKTIIDIFFCFGERETRKTNITL